MCCLRKTIRCSSIQRIVDNTFSTWSQRWWTLSLRQWISHSSVPENHKKIAEPQIETQYTDVRVIHGCYCTCHSYISFPNYPASFIFSIRHPRSMTPHNVTDWLDCPATDKQTDRRPVSPPLQSTTQPYHERAWVTDPRSRSTPPPPPAPRTRPH